jgi:DNA-directed RNA polymerase specialized sigma24 family protein
MCASAPAQSPVTLPEPPNYTWLRDCILYSPYWEHRLVSIDHVYNHFKPYVEARAKQAKADLDEVLSAFSDRICRLSFDQKWRPDHGFSGCIPRMVTNLIRDYFRSAKSKGRGVGRAQDTDSLVYVPVPSGPSSSSSTFTRTATPGPGRIPPKRVIGECRAACLVKLSERNRRVIVLLDSGCSSTEAAEQTGTTQRAIHQLSLRLRQAVAKRLRKAGWDVPERRGV